MVDAVDCCALSGDHAWRLENPRLIKPFKVHATAGFFYVANIPEIIPNTEESYRQYVHPLCARGETEVEDRHIASLFSPVPDEAQIACEVDRDKFELARKEYPYNRRD